MATITFSGSVSAQIAAGEAVTIVVTKPDGTKDTWTTTTKADLTFSVTETYTIAGAYSAIFSIAADAGYTSATTAVLPFAITLATRSITANVTVA